MYCAVQNHLCFHLAQRDLHTFTLSENIYTSGVCFHSLKSYLECSSLFKKILINKSFDYVTKDSDHLIFLKKLRILNIDVEITVTSPGHDVTEHELFGSSLNFHDQIKGFLRSLPHFLSGVLSHAAGASAQDCRGRDVGSS